MNTVKVAVYGTLKAGYNNHPVLGTKAKLIGTGYTNKRYDMKDSGFPVIVPNDKGKEVLVEVYEVPEEQLIPLDRLEGVPRMYTREKTTVTFMLEQDMTEWMDVFIYEGTSQFNKYPDYKSKEVRYHNWKGWQPRQVGTFA